MKSSTKTTRAVSSLPAAKSASHFTQAVIIVGLILLPLLVFIRVTGHDYVSYDDGDYVYENIMVQKGLTPESVQWAFTQSHAANWHPLTWLSHMLDWQIHGNKPGGHHFTSLLFHIANTLLIFSLFRTITRRTSENAPPESTSVKCEALFGSPHNESVALWGSAFVAALFAIHPVHVESVAWLAERKDVLCTFFGLLTLLSYARYARARTSHHLRGSAAAYLLTLALFACGLMSKPMLVTLPFVLLLLDFWPLGRMSSEADALIQNWKLKFQNLLLLVLEKAPFFALSAISSFITYKVQLGKTVQTLANFSIADRMANVLVAYAAYLGKMIWPSKLAFFYPLVKAPPLWEAALAGIFLATVTALVIWQMAKRPFLAFGWFWYLGTLVPVIGLVHVGEQSHADRYTYIPSIGIFLAATWALAEFAQRKNAGKSALYLSAVVVLGAFSAAAWKQTGHWKNSRAMLQRALAVTEQNFLAHNNYGVILADEGKELESRNQADEARAKYEEAITHYAQAVRWKPLYARAHDNWGSALTFLGRYDEAIEEYKKALSLNPNEARTHYNLAVTLARQNRFDETIAACREALRLNPDYVDAHYDLGSALSLKGQLAEAAAEYEKFLAAKPEDGSAHYLLATVHLRQKKFQKAALHFRQAIAFKPEFLEAYTKFAWMLATSPEASARNGSEAVRIAERAAQMTRFQNPIVLGILGAAFAEAGHFDQAISTAQKALELAEHTGRKEAAESLRQQLELFRAGKAIR